MGRKVGMVHAGCFNVQLFNEVLSEIMPDVAVVHLVDEGLPIMTSAEQRGQVVRRLKALSSFAEESGAEVVMLTCTAFGRLVDEVKESVSIPVLSVLEIMVEEAMNAGDRIGILGTHPAMLASAVQLIQEESTEQGRKTEVKTLLCPGAFDALRRNDMATHDRIVLEYANQLMDEVDVIVVPQPSMDKVMKQVPEASRRVPIVASVNKSAQRLKEVLDSLA
jgi:aspartate/glutamate racemase